MSRMSLRRPERRKCFPRVSGDEPQSITEPTAVLMFSPRERG